MLLHPLKSNHSLITVFLADNHIGDTGAQAISEGLKLNGTLAFLSLFDNDIGNLGATSFAEALKLNNSIDILYLNGNRNPIGDVGALAILEALKSNCHISWIGLHGGLISKDILKYIYEQLDLKSATRNHYLKMTICKCVRHFGKISNIGFDKNLLECYIFPYEPVRPNRKRKELNQDLSK